MTEQGKPRAIELPMTELDETVEQCVDDLDGKQRNCLRNAFQHLRKSWKLHHVDDEMSAFRAITAEEEAASALILALKAKGYPGAGQLKERVHNHKMVVYQVVLAANNFISEMTDLPKIKIRIGKGPPPKVDLVVALPIIDTNGEQVHVSPDNPLNFFLSEEGGVGGPSTIFDAKLNDIMQSKGKSNFDNYVKAEANLRNAVLYASEEGIPSIQFSDSFILERLKRVCVLSVICICVSQYEGTLLLVRQSLEVVLAKLSGMTMSGFVFDPETDNPNPNRINIDLSR